MSSIEITATQRLVLEGGAARPDRALDPMPEGIKGGARLKVCASLERRGLAEQTDGAGWRVTAAGLALVGVVEDDVSETALPRAGSKLALAVDMLRRPDGASLEQMMVATGWQRHTVRGTMSGAIKGRFGLDIVSNVGADGVRVYRIA